MENKLKNNLNKPYITRSNECFTSSDILGLDFDGKDNFNINDFLIRCNKYKIYPIIIYETFSSTKQLQKFRSIFKLSDRIFDLKIKSLLQQMLMQIFPECDKTCKDSCRIFFGTNKKVSYNNNIDLNTSLLLNAFNDSLNNTTNYKLYLNRFCEKTNIGVLNNSLFITNNNNELNNINVNNITKYDNYNFVFNNVKVKNTKKYKLSDTIKSTIKLKNLNYDKLNCKLWNDFYSGKDWLYYQQLFGLISNLKNYINFSHKLKNGMLNRRKIDNVNCYDDNIINKYQNILIDLQNRNIHEQKCNAFCPYYKTKCKNNCEYIINTENNKITNNIKLNNLNDYNKIKKEMLKSFDYIYKQDNGFYIIKAETGIGKTEFIANNLKNNMVIAFSTHRKKDEFIKYLNSLNLINGKDFIIQIQKPSISKKYKTIYNSLIAKGLINKASELYQYLANNYYYKMNNNLISNTLTDDELNMALYYKNCKDIFKTNLPILTVHHKVLTNNMNILKNNKFLIFDEDPISTCLFKDIKIKLEDIKYLCYLLNENCLTNEYNILNNFIKLIEFEKNVISEFNPYCLNNKKIKLNYEMVNEIIANNKFSHPIGELFKDDNTNWKFYSTGQYVHIYKNNYNLLNWKKTLITSATSEKYIYPNCDKFFDHSNIKHIGEINFININYSRQKLKELVIDNNNTYVNNFILSEEFKSISKNKKCITYKSYQQLLKDVNADVVDNIYFGNANGYNELSGMDGLIVGTPNNNEHKYLCIAAGLGLNIKNTKKIYSYVNFNGLEYKMLTYEDTNLQKIQHDVIYNEIIQSVGRFRTINNSCEVLLIGNVPINNCNIFNSPQEYLEYKNRTS
jgi:hypothetical protein